MGLVGTEGTPGSQMSRSQIGWALASLQRWACIAVAGVALLLAGRGVTHAQSGYNYYSSKTDESTLEEMGLVSDEFEYNGTKNVEQVLADAADEEITFMSPHDSDAINVVEDVLKDTGIWPLCRSNGGPMPADLEIDPVLKEVYWTDGHGNKVGPDSKHAVKVRIFETRKPCQQPVEERLTKNGKYVDTIAREYDGQEANDFSGIYYLFLISKKKFEVELENGDVVKAHLLISAPGTVGNYLVAFWTPISIKPNKILLTAGESADEDHRQIVEDRVTSGKLATRLKEDCCDNADDALWFGPPVEAPGLYVMFNVGLWKADEEKLLGWQSSLRALEFIAQKSKSGSRAEALSFNPVNLFNTRGRFSGDFGDAPDPYPTVANDDGALHFPEDGFQLGSSVDTEADGQPSPDASADNGDDGVTFNNTTGYEVKPGQTQQISVNASAAGQLDAFADWNRDGDWQGSGEQVFANEALSSGDNTLDLTAPSDAGIGPTVARFRFSETGGLAATGGASDAPRGEVEDYVVEVTPEDVSEVTSTVVEGDGEKDFGDLAINFAGVEGSATVSVYRGGEPPKNENIPKENVAKYSYVVEPLGSFSFGDQTEVRFKASELGGLNEDPGAVTVYRRDKHDEGTFEELTTTVDDNGTPDDISDDEIVVNVSDFSEFALASDTEPLPVELTRLEATHQDGRVLLSWRTASETNNAGFHVERRVPESNQWNELGFVEGAGTTQEPQTYRFADEDLPFAADSLTYRLRQVDADGTSSLSDEVTVHRGTPQSVRLLAPYPNPAGAQATVRYTVPTRRSVRLAVYNELGERVMTVQSGTVEAGRKELQLDTSRLSSGVYFLRLVAGEESQSRRLTVVR